MFLFVERCDYCIGLEFLLPIKISNTFCFS